MDKCALCDREDYHAPFCPDNLSMRLGGASAFASSVVGRPGSFFESEGRPKEVRESRVQTGDLEQVNHELNLVLTMLEAGNVGSATVQLERTQATIYSMLR